MWVAARNLFHIQLESSDVATPQRRLRHLFSFEVMLQLHTRFLEPTAEYFHFHVLS